MEDKERPRNFHRSEEEMEIWQNAVWYHVFDLGMKNDITYEIDEIQNFSFLFI